MIWILWILFSIFVGIAASGRGRSGFGYFLLSLLLSPIIGLIIVLVAGPNRQKIAAQAEASGELKKCPACAEHIKREAVKCRYCGTDLSPTA